MEARKGDKGAWTCCKYFSAHEPLGLNLAQVPQCTDGRLMSTRSPAVHVLHAGQQNRTGLCFCSRSALCFNFTADRISPASDGEDSTARIAFSSRELLPGRDAPATNIQIASHHLPRRLQATRQLARMGLPPELAARLAQRSLTTARDLFGKTLLDLVELLDLPYHTVRQILHEVAARITPQPQTVGVRGGEQTGRGRDTGRGQGAGSLGRGGITSLLLMPEWPSSPPLPL